MDAYLQSAQLLTTLRGAAATYPFLSVKRQGEVVAEADRLLGLLRTIDGAARQLTLLERGLKSTPAAALPRLVGFAEGFLRKKAPALLAPTLFGVVPDLPIAEENLAAARKFIETRLELTGGILERLSRLRTASAPFRGKIDAPHRELLEQIDGCQRMQETLSVELPSLSTSTAAAATRRVTSHYLHVRLLETLFMAHQQLGNSLRSGTVNGLWSEATPSSGPVETPWVALHRAEILAHFAGFSKLDQNKALLLCEDYEGMYLRKEGRSENPLNERPFDPEVLAAALVRRGDSFYPEVLVSRLLEYLERVWPLGVPSSGDLSPLVEKARDNRQRLAKEVRPLFPERYEFLPGREGETLGDYLLGNFGLDLSSIRRDAEAKEEFRQVVGVVPRTVLRWGKENRPDKIGYVIALYRYLVEYAWQQQLLYRQRGEETVDLPDPLHLLRLAYGGTATPFFNCRSEGDLFRVPVPPEVADLPLERIFYGPVLQRIMESLDLFPDELAAQLRAHYGEAVTADTLERHGRGRVDPRDRIERSRETERLLLGGPLDFFLEVLPYLRAVGIPVGVTETTPAREGDSYCVLLVPEEGVAADLSTNPTLDLAEPPLLYLRNGQLGEVLATTRRMLDLSRELLGWEEDWPVCLRGMRVQNLRGLYGALEELGKNLAGMNEELLQIELDPSRASPSTLGRVMDLIHRVLRLYLLVRELPKRGHLVLGERGIDYQLGFSGEAGVVEVSPDFLVRELQRGTLTMDEARQLLHARVARSLFQALYGEREGDADLLPGRELLPKLKEWEAFDRERAPIHPLLHEGFVREFLARSLRARNRLRATSRRALERGIADFCWSRHGVPPEEGGALLTGVEIYLRLNQDAKKEFQELPFRQAARAVFGESPEAPQVALFLELLGWLGFPIGDGSTGSPCSTSASPSSAPGSPSPADPPSPDTVSSSNRDVPQVVTMEGVLTPRIEAFVGTLLREEDCRVAILILRGLVSSHRETLLSGTPVEEGGWRETEEEIRRDLTTNFGLEQIALPPLAAEIDSLSFLRALEEDLTWIADPVSFPEGEVSSAVRWVREALLADHVEEVPPKVDEWLMGIRVKLLDEQSRWERALPKGVCYRDRAEWWCAFRIAEREVTEELLVEHDRRMRVFFPLEIPILPRVRKVLDPLPEVYVPPIPEIPNIPGSWSRLARYLFQRFGWDGDEGDQTLLQRARDAFSQRLERGEAIPERELAEFGEFRPVAEGLVRIAQRIRREASPVSERGPATVVASLQVAALLSDEVTLVGEKVLAILQQLASNTKPDSPLFKRAESALAVSRTPPEPPPISMEDLMALVRMVEESEGRAAVTSREGWERLFIGMGKEVGLNIPSSSEEWKAFLEGGELRAVIAGEEDPLRLRRRLNEILSPYPSENLPPPSSYPRAAYPPREVQIFDDGAYRAFWREVLQCLQEAGREPCQVMTWLDTEGKPRAALISKEEYERVSGIKTAGDHGGYLRPVPVVTPGGETLTLDHLHIALLFDIPAPSRLLQLRFVRWALNLPEGYPAYEDLHFVMATQFAFRYMGDFTLDHLRGLTELNDPLEVRRRLNQFWGEHEGKLRRALLSYSHLGFLYLSGRLIAAVTGRIGDREQTFPLGLLTELSYCSRRVSPTLIEALKRGIKTYERGEDPTAGCFVEALLSLWPAVRDELHQRGEGLEAVTPGEVAFLKDSISMALESYDRSVPNPAVDFYEKVGRGLADHSTPLARALARLLSPPLFSQAPLPHVEELRALLGRLSREPIVAGGVLEREVVAFYRKREGEVLWRIRERAFQDPERYGWMLPLLPSESCMPRKFALGDRFPEVEALTYAECDRILGEAESVLRFSRDSAALNIDRGGLEEKIIISREKAIIWMVGRDREGEIVVGVKGDGGESLFFPGIIRQSEYLVGRTPPVDRAPRVTVTDRLGVPHLVREEDVYQTVRLDPSPDSSPIQWAQMTRQIGRRAGLRDLLPIFIVFYYTSHNGPVAENPPETHEIVHLVRMINALPPGGGGAPDEMAEIRKQMIDVYAACRRWLVTAGIDRRFAERMG